MKNKAVLVLMEQLIMVLVFALAAALCLRCFGAAAILSAETVRRDEAVRIAQNAAECLKAGREPDVPPADSSLSLEIRKISGELPGFCRAEIRVMEETDVVFALNAGWQEVDG